MRFFIIGGPSITLVVCNMMGWFTLKESGYGICTVNDSQGLGRTFFRPANEGVSYKPLLCLKALVFSLHRPL